MKIRVNYTVENGRGYLNAVPFDAEASENPLYKVPYCGLNGIMCPRTETEKLFYRLNIECQNQENGREPNENWDKIEIPKW